MKFERSFLLTSYIAIISVTSVGAMADESTLCRTRHDALSALIEAHRAKHDLDLQSIALAAKVLDAAQNACRNGDIEFVLQNYDAVFEKLRKIDEKPVLIQHLDP